MPRSKPELFLTVPTSIEPQTFTRSDLITPPCYVVSAPPPLVTPRPIPPRDSPSSSKTTRSTSSECDFDLGDSEDSPLWKDRSSWDVDQESSMLPVQLDENSMQLIPFEFTKLSFSLTNKFSQSAPQNSHRGHRSVAATRRCLLRLARENSKEDRMDIDSVGSPSITLSTARLRSHPYARNNLSASFQHLPLASPFHEKRFEIPLSPSPNPMETGA